ncbi:MAG: GIY-YIG nuclease family protein [Ignavibacteriota bacterium]
MPGWRNLPAGRQVGRRTGLKVIYFVYAIKSKNRNYIYVGLTNSIERRLAEHNGGTNKTTKPYRPFSLIYSEQFETRIQAREKEKYLKSGSGKEFLKNLAI